MASYRLIDELPDARKRLPPFSPIGLFFLTWLFLPVAAPFWIINWGRLGHPEKRLITGVLAAAAFALPIVFVLVSPDQKEMARPLNTLAKFAFAYFQLFGQRPLYDAHLMRGGQKAPAWPVWIAAGVALLIFLLPLLTS